MKYKVAKSKIHGDGIFATQPIAKGEYISDTPDYIDNVNQTIASSFHNHDEKNANVLNIKKGNKRFLIAKRGIEAGEELTTDYNLTPSPPFEDPKNFKDLDERELPLSDEEVQEMIDAGFVLEEMHEGGSPHEHPYDYEDAMQAYKDSVAAKEAYEKQYALDLKNYTDDSQHAKDIYDKYNRNQAYINYIQGIYPNFNPENDYEPYSTFPGLKNTLDIQRVEELDDGRKRFYIRGLHNIKNSKSNLSDFMPPSPMMEFYHGKEDTHFDNVIAFDYIPKPKISKPEPAPEYNAPEVLERPNFADYVDPMPVNKPELIKQDATLQEIVGVPNDGLVEDYVLDEDGNIAGSVRVPAGTKQNRRRNYRKLKRGKLDGTMGVFNGERYSHGGPKVKQRRGVRENPDGSESTHLMRAEYIPERGWVAFPSLFQDDDGTWVDMSEEENWEKILKEATKRGEVYEFGDDKFGALAFGMGSWKPENQNYNLKRALELGYEPDETGHWPSVDYQTGMFLKSMDHPTAFKEYMYGQLNKDIGTNTRVVVNPEGPFGDKQLQYVELTDEEADKYRAGGYILEEMDEGGGTSKKKNPLKPTNSFTKSDLASLYKEWQNRVNIDPSLEPIEFEAFVNLRLQEQQDGNLAFTDYFVGGPEGGKLYKAEDVKSLIYDKGDLSQQLQAKGLGSENTIKYILTPDIGKAENQKGKRIANYLQKGYSEGKTYKQLTKEMSDKGWISEKYGPKYYENLNDAVVNQMVEARKKFFDAYKTQTQQEIDDTEQYSDRFTYLGQSNADRKKYPAGSFEQWQATQNLNERVAKKLEAEKEFNNLQDQYNQQTNAGANVADATSFVNPIAPLNINTSIKPAGQNEFTYRSSPQISAKNADKFDLSATIDPASIESINKSKADYDEYAKALTSYMTSRGQMNTINKFQDIDWDNLSSEKKLELLQEYDPDSKSFGVADAQSYAERVLQAPEYMSSINPTMQNSGRVSMVYPEMFFMGPAAGAAGVTKQALGKTLGFVQRQLAKNPVNWASKKLLGKELPSALKFATNPGNLLTADFAYHSFKPDGFVPNLAEGVRDVYQGVEGGREKIVDNAFGALWAVPAARGLRGTKNLIKTFRGTDAFMPVSSNSRFGNYALGYSSPSGNTNILRGNPDYLIGDGIKNFKPSFEFNFPGIGRFQGAKYTQPTTTGYTRSSNYNPFSSNLSLSEGIGSPSYKSAFNNNSYLLGNSKFNKPFDPYGDTDPDINFESFGSSSNADAQRQKIADINNKIIDRTKQEVADLSSPEGIRRLTLNYKNLNPNLNEEEIDHLVATTINEVNAAGSQNIAQYLGQEGSFENMSVKDAENFIEEKLPTNNAYFTPATFYGKQLRGDTPADDINFGLDAFRRWGSDSSEIITNLGENMKSVPSPTVGSYWFSPIKRTDMWTGAFASQNPVYMPGSITTGKELSDNPTIAHEFGHAIQRDGLTDTDIKLQQLFNKEGVKGFKQRQWNNKVVRDNPGSEYILRAGQNYFYSPQRGIQSMSPTNKRYYSMPDEGFPMAREFRQDLIDKGYLGSKYEKITPSILTEYGKSSTPTLENRAFYMASPSKYGAFSDILNNMPSWLAPTIGTGFGLGVSLGNEKDGGFIEMNLTDDEAKMYTAGGYILEEIN